MLFSRLPPMATVALLPLLLLAAASERAVTNDGLTFHPPVLVGTGAGFADNFHAVSRRIFIGSSGGGFLSTSGGGVRVNLGLK